MSNAEMDRLRAESDANFRVMEAIWRAGLAVRKKERFKERLFYVVVFGGYIGMVTHGLWTGWIVW